MLKAYNSFTGNESGNVLLLAVMVMVALTAVALTSARISNTNMATSTNEKFHKGNFFKTDGDVEVSTAVLIETVNERQTPTPGATGGLAVNNPDFIYNPPGIACPTPANADVQLNVAGGGAASDFKNDTFVTYSIQERINPGNAIQIAEGYHGRGKGLASGGLIRIYTTRGLGIGMGNSQTRITSTYQHVP